VEMQLVFKRSNYFLLGEEAEASQSIGNTLWHV